MCSQPVDAREENKKVVDSDNGSFRGCEAQQSPDSISGGSVVDATTNNTSVTAHDLGTSATMIQVLHDGTRRREMNGG
jgi:hypothetical protein